MSSNNRNQHTSGGQTNASHTRKSTVASAIPSAHSAATTDVLSATAATVSGSDTAAPVKRGRGRPRKNPVETNSINKDDDNDDVSGSGSEDVPEVAPRKRGRPPKLNKVVPPVVDPSVPKRGRGRPRKNPLPTDENDTNGVSVSGSGSTTSSSKVAPSGLQGAGHHASTAEPPRKRGRPRKE
ncbi:hypothetical protein BGZ96_009417 [Linnemannia gamsii]|uniref:AT hook domain-containing protein n=1 Tax=Linnemannia gamsii TaxID=64522 RepID=A0ABQ7KCI4_9FUNG|nr:hypothetical protein BGZ96_009417 [Linnemannia gamsii]